MHPLFFRAKRGYYATLRYAWPRLAKVQLTPARYDVLRCLFYVRNFEGEQDWLREVLGVARSTLSRMLRALETLGFIRRWVDPNDHRYRICKLTAEGRTRVEFVLREYVKSGATGKVVNDALVNATARKHTPPVRAWSARSLFYRFAIAFERYPDPPFTSLLVVSDDAAQKATACRRPNFASRRATFSL